MSKPRKNSLPRVTKFPLQTPDRIEGLPLWHVINKQIGLVLALRKDPAHYFQGSSDTQP